MYIQAKTKVKHCQSSGQASSIDGTALVFFFRKVGLGFSKEFCQQARCRQCHLILKLQQCPKLKLHFPAELPLTNAGLEMCRRGHPTDSGCAFPAPVESSGFCQLSIVIIDDHKELKGTACSSAPGLAFIFMCFRGPEVLCHLPGGRSSKTHFRPPNQQEF